MPNGNKKSAPDRQKATKMALYYKICAVVGFVFLMAFMIVGVFYLKKLIEAPIFWLSLLPVAATALLGNHFKRQEMRLRCTVRATAICVETVRVRTFSGKHYDLRPVVKFEANGVQRKATVPVPCTCDAVGETYVIYYDPLDPSTVREE